MKSSLCEVSDKDRFVNAFKYWHGGVFFHIEQCERIREMLRNEHFTNADKLTVIDAVDVFQQYLSDVAIIGNVEDDNKIKGL